MLLVDMLESNGMGVTEWKWLLWGAEGGKGIYTLIWGRDLSIPGKLKG